MISNDLTYRNLQPLQIVTQVGALGHDHEANIKEPLSQMETKRFC